MKYITTTDVLRMMSKILDIPPQDIQKVFNCWKYVVGHYLSSVDDDCSIPIPEVLKVEARPHDAVVKDIDKLKITVYKNARDVWSKALQTKESPLVNKALEKIETDIINNLAQKSLI